MKNYYKDISYAIQGEKKPLYFDDTECVIDVLNDRIDNEEGKEIYSSGDIREFLDQLSITDGNDLKNCFDEKLNMTKWGWERRCGIVLYRDNFYYIDGQGYDYARYVTKIINYTPQSPIIFI